MRLILKLVIVLPLFIFANSALAGKTTIVFVRHGETVYNKTGKSSGENTLTSLGKRQARKLVRTLSKTRFDKIYVSPKGRTKKTIKPYLKSIGRRLPSKVSNSGYVQIWKELTECCWRSDNKKRAMKRLRAAVRRIKSRHHNSGDTILIVGHSMSGRRLVKMLTGGPTLRLRNGSPVVLQESRNGKFKIVARNGSIP